MGYEKQRDSSLFIRDYLESLLVETRYIDSKTPDTSLELYGKRFSSPVMLALASDSESVHKAETIAAARKAGESGIICRVDAEEKERLSEITDTGAAAIKIIRPYADNKVVFSQIEQAQECNVLAVGIDISLAFDGRGKECGLGEQRMAPKSMEEIREFVSAASVPFIVKGILSKKDAYKCLTAGVDGIVMSVPDSLSGYAVSPLMALPGVLNAVNAQIPVFVDCEKANGFDVFKTLALGASAVFVKQTVSGSRRGKKAEDVPDRINSINEELKSFMAQTGCHNLLCMDKTVLWQI